MVEDAYFAREAVRRKLADTSHMLVREAATLQDAVTAIDDIAGDELDCDVVLLDGDLDMRTPGARHPYPGYAASMVVSRIREHGLGLKVVGFSANSLTELGIRVDIDLTKQNIDGLEAALAEL